jgi:site-specific DNA-methyltransferase (adenine-specific)
VLFTIEWAGYLQEKGYTDIAVAVDTHDKIIQWLCNTVGLKYMLLNEIKEKKMKFDVVVGNPPYQIGKNKILYRSFVELSFKLTNQIVAMITPASWNCAGFTPYKKTIINNGLKYYSYLGTSAFNTSQNDVSYFICETNYTGPVTVTSKTNSLIIEHVSEHGIIPHNHLNQTPILLKLARFSGVDSAYRRGITNPEKLPSGSSKFVVRNGFANKPVEELKVVCDDNNVSVGFNRHKVTIAYNSSIGNIGPLKYVDPTYSIGYAVVCFEFSTVDECNSFIQYMNSPIIKFVIQSLKTSIQNSKNIFEKVPKIDVTRYWSNEELYQHFNLTQEEIDYIEATVK